MLGDGIFFAAFSPMIARISDLPNVTVSCIYRYVNVTQPHTYEHVHIKVIYRLYFDMIFQFSLLLLLFIIRLT